jgi:DNA-binding PadR family transcriptional regulator
MDHKRIDEWQFWALLAIADRERNLDEIRNRMASLFRASGASTQVPGTVNPIIQALCEGGLIEKFDGSGLFGRHNYRVTGAGHQACRDEIDLRRRELDAIGKDKDVRRWLDRSARR